MSHSRSRQALVIGGGIAGPVTAMALQRAGFEATVCERGGQEPNELGTYLTIATNGLDALRAIDAHTTVVEAGFATSATTMSTSSGLKLGRFSVGSPLTDGTLSQTIKRPVLHRVLRDRALDEGVTFTFHKRLVHAVNTRQGVAASFSDGTEAHADILVGCDGLHSPTRHAIDPHAPEPRYVGMVNFGGYTPRGPYSPPPATEAGVWHMMFGRRAFFGHVIDPCGGTVWFANITGERIPKDERESTDEAHWRSLLEALSVDDAGPIHELVRNGRLDVVADNTYDLASVPRWHAGSMVIIGDAAHAPSSISGQGASLAHRGRSRPCEVPPRCTRDLGGVRRVRETPTPSGGSNGPPGHPWHQQSGARATRVRSAATSRQKARSPDPGAGHRQPHRAPAPRPRASLGLLVPRDGTIAGLDLQPPHRLERVNIRPTPGSDRHLPARNAQVPPPGMTRYAS